MRPIPTSFAVVALTATFMVVPTVTSGATPRPVSPVVHDVAVPAVAGVGTGTAKRSATVSGTAAATGDRHGAGDPVVATKQVQGVDFDLAGVTFDTTPPAGTHVEVRTHGESGWSGWTDLGLDGDGPDPGSADARHARPGTEAVAAAGSDGIDIRVTTPDGTLPRGLRASLVDGGRSSADDALSAPAGSAVAAVTRPTIISRAQWGADESLRTCDAERLPGFKAVVVHHTVNSNTYTADQAPAIIRSIYAYHTQSQGWCDIGYQILVDRFGRAYEGRKGSPAGFVQGAQAGGFNAETTGISVIGDFTSVPFPAATQSTVTKLVAWEADRSLFDPTSSVTLTSSGNSKFDPGQKVTLPRTIGHRDLSLTGCPGDTAYAKQLPTIRSNAGAIWRDGQWNPMAPRAASETYPRPTNGRPDVGGPRIRPRRRPLTVGCLRRGHEGPDVAADRRLLLPRHDAHRPGRPDAARVALGRRHVGHPVLEGQRHGHLGRQAAVHPLERLPMAHRPGRLGPDAAGELGRGLVHRDDMAGLDAAAHGEPPLHVVGPGAAAERHPA